MEEKKQGVVLQAIPYLDKGRILKVFSRESGMVSLMAKKKTLPSLAPFCIAEFVYKTRQSDLGMLIDASLIDSLVDLRKSYEILTTAGSMAQDLLRSQLPGKASPGLYDLLCSYFKKLPEFHNPDVLSASFQLKLLLHDGLLALADECALCGKPASVLMQGESFCPEHAPFLMLTHSENDWRTLHHLAFARQFSILQNTDLSKSLKEKIRSLFEERIKD